MLEHEHTPLPWAIEQCGDSYSIVNRDFDSDEWDIGEIYAQGNAEFVVRVCGAHDELLDALRNMVGMFDTPVVRRHYNSDFHREACESARAAIAKAERRP